MLRIEALLLSTVQGKCIYKAENQEIKFQLLCAKPSKDKHKFFFVSKVGSPGPIYRSAVPSMYYEFD